MNITRLLFNPFGENTHVLWHENGKDAFVIDPGMMNDDENDFLATFLQSHNLNVTKVLLTHLHIDHVTGAVWTARKYNATIEYNEKDQMVSEHLSAQAAMFGLNIRIEPFVADVFLKDGDSLYLNGEEIKVLETPGHSPGSLSFYLPESGKLIAGDTIFEMSIGRTDLPGGNYDQIISSIKTKIMTLPGDTVIYPGHGSVTTVADEQKYNSFLK